MVAYPYAQLGFVAGERQPGVAVLAQYAEGYFQWVAGDQFEMVISPEGKLLVYRLGEEQLVLDWTRVPDFPHVDEYDVRVLQATWPGSAGQGGMLRCMVRERTPQQITILQQSFGATYSQHECSGPELGTVIWQFWHDDSDRVWRFEGAYAPGATSFHLDTLKVPM